MAELKLNSVKFNKNSLLSSYVTSSVVDCIYGFEGVKIINTTEELNRYYFGLSNRDGFEELLKAGSSLLIKRLNRLNTSNSNLRILNNSIVKYTYPRVFDSIEPEFSSTINLNPYSTRIQFEGLDNSIQYNYSYTYNYVIDFGNSSMEDEDYIAIPKFNNSDLDNSVLFYFTDFTPSSGVVKFPDDFTPTVPLDSIGVDTIGINSSNDSLLSQRAKIIYDWYLGNLVNEDNKFNLSGNSGDSNLIEDLCELDEANNKVTLVFKEPISNIKYFNSKGSTKFEVYSNEYKNFDLITQSTLNDSVVSFETYLEGESEMTIKLEYVKDYEYVLYIDFQDVIESFAVSLDRNSVNSLGESIFIEDVIAKDFDLLKCEVHLGTRIESTGSDNFSMEDALSIEGSYKLSKGKLGLNEPTYSPELSYWRYPFYDSIDEIENSDVDINTFMFDEFIGLNYQSYTENKLLSPYYIVGLVSVPDHYLYVRDLKDEVEDILMPRNKRQYIIYTLGKSVYKERIINNTFYYCLSAIENKFLKYIIDNKFISEVFDESKEKLDTYKINYIESNKKGYFINFIQNFPEHLSPIYLFVANFIHVSVKRFLRNKLGTLQNKIYNELESELSTLKSYSNLIEEINIEEFESDTNNLTTTINLEIKGLVNRVVPINIKINN